MAARPRLGIARRLLAWYQAGHRDLPWRRTSDPYRIWISEVMLQQTRAGAVIPYYNRFLDRFPTVEALAAAPENDLLALWAGLGYYSRARNLKRAAQAMAGGGFPRDYESLRALPGIGDYTASAIGSIAFGLPHAVVDGNVLRVVARIENDAADIAAPRTRERFRGIAQRWLEEAPADSFGAFNQALMELGATVCVPRNPACPACPLRDSCRAQQSGTAAQLPVKLRRQDAVAIQASLLLVLRDEEVLLKQRGNQETRMPGFWDLPSPGDLPAAKLGECCGEFRHSITHHRYTFQVFRASLRKWIPRREFAWFPISRLGEIPLSTTARKGLKRAAVPCI